MPYVTVDQRASLTYWPPGPSGVADDEGQEFASVCEALVAVAGRQPDSDERPWIVMEDGAILTPTWIEATLAGRGSRRGPVL